MCFDLLNVLLRSWTFSEAAGRQRYAIRGLMPRFLKVASFFLLVPVFTVSCGPVYRTTYSYDPPETAEGQRCVTHCQFIESQCENQERLIHDNCEMRAELTQSNCMARRRYDHEGKCKRYCYCSRPYCASPSFESCKVKYNQCYQNCGGGVSSSTECVRNCEKADELR